MNYGFQRSLTEPTEVGEREKIILVIIQQDQTEERNLKTEKSLDRQTPSLTRNAPNTN